MSSNFKTFRETHAAKGSNSTWSIQYVTGDLFSCPPDESLAHCISQDCHMGAGIAVRFKRQFRGVESLKDQNKQVGECAVLSRGNRFIYYLITKSRYRDIPEYSSLTRSLEDMKCHCLSNGVNKVSMPRIGCGLDTLEWEEVSRILTEVFDSSNISITVYSLPERRETTVMKENSRRKSSRHNYNREKCDWQMYDGEKYDPPVRGQGYVRSAKVQSRNAQT